MGVADTLEQGWLLELLWQSTVLGGGWLFEQILYANLLLKFAIYLPFRSWLVTQFEKSSAILSNILQNEVDVQSVGCSRILFRGAGKLINE